MTGKVVARGGGDEVVTYRGLLPIIIWDAETRQRRTVTIRWGVPSRTDWRRPKPIHGRPETIDVREPFRTPILSGQRGIVAFKTFNEGL